jgi:hypothetical protein
MFRWLRRSIVAIALGLALLLVLAAWGTGFAGVPHATGYFSPLFAADGQSVFAITRDVRATVFGFGRDFFSGPATVHLLRDRFRLVNVRVSDGRVTVVEEFPPSPFEGTRIQAYHNAIFGEIGAHLHWADAEHLDYEIAVTRHEVPVSRTYAIRKRWDVKARAFFDTIAQWKETPAVMGGGAEPQQLHGDLEVVAVPGSEMMPCAIAVLGRGEVLTRALVETIVCERKYESGLSAVVLAPFSRRADIERSEKMRTTYAELVRQGRAAGRTEAEAMLLANEEMSRLGYYPKTTKLVADVVACTAAEPVFHISEDELKSGLFPDIEKAMATPLTEVDKSMGSYITHRDYSTSRHLNTYLDAGHSSFFVETRDVCWHLTIKRP